MNYLDFNLNLNLLSYPCDVTIKEVDGFNDFGTDIEPLTNVRHPTHGDTICIMKRVSKEPFLMRYFIATIH